VGSNTSHHYLIVRTQIHRPISGPPDDCTCTYRLFAIKKQLHLQVINDTGEDDYIPLEHTLRSVVTKGHRYHYSDHYIPCQTHHGHTHKVSIPWNGWKSFNSSGKNRLDPVTEKQYKKILLYLQPHAPGSDQFKEAYGIRERTETMHSILDSLLPSKPCNAGVKKGNQDSSTGSSWATTSWPDSHSWTDTKNSCTLTVS